MVKKIIYMGLLLLGLAGLVVAVSRKPIARLFAKPLLVKQADKQPVNQDRVRFVEYTPTLFSHLADQRRVLFFAAGWCGNCQQADLDFEKRSNELPQDVTLFRANFDLEKELRQKYGVTYQHTFVLVDSQGNLEKIWNGGDTDELLTQLGL